MESDSCHFSLYLLVHLAFIMETRPPSWSMAEDKDGKAYYVNNETNETTWERPPEVELKNVADGALDVRMPRKRSRRLAVDGGDVAQVPAERHPNQDAGILFTRLKNSVTEGYSRLNKGFSFC